MAPTAGTRLRMKHAQQKKKPGHKPKKTPSLKNRIRAVQRFLQRGNLDDATRQAKEQELVSLQQQVDAKQQLEQEKQLVEKYKKPRFFERVKLMRKLKKAQKQLKQSDDNEQDKAKFSEQVEKLRRDLMYIYYYPKTEVYIALFPRTPHSEEHVARQKQLQEQACTRFEHDEHPQAFEKFCGDPLVQQHQGNDDDDDDDNNSEDDNEQQHHKNKPLSKSKVKSDLFAKLTKSNKRSKKPKRHQDSQKQKSSTANKRKGKALVDQDEMNQEDNDGKEQPQETQHDQEEEDDFFLS